MNSVCLTGRIGNELELKGTVLKISLAVDKYDFKEKKKATDWITCTAFSKTAETIIKFCSKGDVIGVKGVITTNNYEKDGKKFYNTEVIINDVDFLNTKPKQDSTSDDSEEGLPF